MFSSEDYVVSVYFCPVTCTVQFGSTIMIESDYFLYSYNDIVTFSVDRCFYHTAFVTYGTYGTYRTYRNYRIYTVPYIALAIAIAAVYS